MHELRAPTSPEHEAASIPLCDFGSSTAALNRQLAIDVFLGVMPARAVIVIARKLHACRCVVCCSTSDKIVCWCEAWQEAVQRLGYRWPNSAVEKGFADAAGRLVLQTHCDRQSNEALMDQSSEVKSSQVPSDELSHHDHGHSNLRFRALMRLVSQACNRRPL